MNLEIKVISNINQLKTIEKKWEAILAQNNYPSIALTPQWFTIWWKIRQKKSKKRLYILICLKDNKLIAVFPFYWCRTKYRKIPIRRLSFMVDGISPHADFIIADENREDAIHALLRYLVTNKEFWDVTILDKFQDNATRNLLFKMLTSYNLYYGIQPSLRIPIITIDKSWDLFWSQRSTRFKKSMRNKLNRLKRYGSISVEKVENPNKLIDALPSIFKVSSLSWKGKIKRAITDSPIELAFYKTFTPFGAKMRWVNIWLLKYNNEPIAYEYHLIYNKTVYPLRADFDENYRYLSPGSILEYYILKDMFEKREYDTYYSCADDYFYLRNWTNNFENLHRIDIFNNKMLSYLLYLEEYNVIPKLRKITILRKIKDYIILRRRQ